MPTYALDSRGNRWQWSCGWRIVTKKGELSPMRPLGHKEFRRSIKLLIPSTQGEVLHSIDRPNRTWRRLIHIAPFTYPTFEHFQHGTVKLLATDGQHAVILDRSGAKHYVGYQNLNENKPRVGFTLHSEKKVRVNKKKEETSFSSKKDPMAILADLGLL